MLYKEKHKTETKEKKPIQIPDLNEVFNEVKSAMTTRARHKKVLKQAKGYFGSKHRLYKTAKEQLMHSGQYAFRDRRQKKRDFRSLWITRINAACRENEISYSRFIEGLNKAGVEVNRKMLSEIAISDPKAFSELVKQAKLGLEGKTVAAKKEVKSEVEVLKAEEAVKEVKKTTKKAAKAEEVEEEKTAKKTTKKTSKVEKEKVETENKKATKKSVKKETK